MVLAGETEVIIENLGSARCRDRGGKLEFMVLGDIFNPYDGGLRVSTFICLIGINI